MPLLPGTFGQAINTLARQFDQQLGLNANNRPGQPSEAPTNQNQPGDYRYQPNYVCPVPPSQLGQPFCPIPPDGTPSSLNPLPAFDFSRLEFSNPLDRLPDFSHAGYRSCSTGLPFTGQNSADVVVSETVYPNEVGDSRDRTGDFQDALERVSSKLRQIGPEAEGKKGVVQLLPGTYWMSRESPLLVKYDNVVLQGSTALNPSGPPTVIRVSGPSRCLIVIRPEGYEPHTGPRIDPRRTQKIMDGYVALGTDRVKVKDIRTFKAPNQEILVRRTVTKEWIASLGMDKLVRDGKTQTWIKEGKKIDMVRKVAGIERLGSNGEGGVLGNLILDIPLTDSIDSDKFPGSDAVCVAIDDTRKVLKGVGVSSLHFVIHPSRSGESFPSTPGTTSSYVFEIDQIEDSWIRDIHADGFHQFINLGYGAKRVTVQDCTFIRSAATFTPKTGGRPLPLDISIRGTQILVLRCETRGVKGSDTYTVATQSLTFGPNVVAGYRSNQGRHMIEPHQRYATSLLIDGCQVGRISLINRGIMGSGHGWTINYGLAWNSVAFSAPERNGNLLVMRPPGGQNFMVGCIGDVGRGGGGGGGKDGDGECKGCYYDMGGFVGPKSLFRWQLEKRVGREVTYDILGRWGE